ncbi:uncharacterized protein [Dermacentor andersoni]|uniref:uncharacterized protein n=1 Tax=Dermacentor andersoni TaxID=34620 RepID=UPI002155AC53|nr:uncharacterized protein LOC129380084 [Dermacentor andersoni]
MPGSMASSKGGAAPFGDIVEVVQGDRIRPKAIYRGRRFRLMAVDSTRYRWRCSVSSCSSRLMTDKFGEKHVLYSFKEHDEDEHRAAEGRRQSNKSFRSEIMKKVGDFLYVPERTVGDIKCWRCRYISCPGRCRTSLDGEQLLHGPTAHTCQSLSREELARPPHDQPLSSQDMPADLSQGVKGTGTGASERQQEQHGDNAAELAGYLSLHSPDVIFCEEYSPSPPASSPAVNVSATRSDGDSRSAHETASRTAEVSGVPEEDAGPSHRVPSLFGSQKQTSGPGKPSAAATCVEEADMVESFHDGSDDDASDEDEGRPRRGDDEYNEVEGHLRSRLRCGGQTIGSPAKSVQALEMMSTSCACAEQKLRVAVYKQLSTVLSMEAKLLREQMRNEVRRGRLLENQMKKGPLRQSDCAPGGWAAAPATDTKAYVKDSKAQHSSSVVTQ